MELSIALTHARRIYLNKEKPEAIAKELSITTKALHISVRLAFPMLISEENWDIPKVMEHLGGREVPLEMRKEIQKLVKKHGLTEAVRLTTCSVGSAARWGRGEHGKNCVQEMGNLPWKSLLTGATVVTDDNKRHKNAKLNEADRRKVVYRMITERPDLNVLANEYKISVTALYNWRAEMLGKTNTKKYKELCATFIEKVAAELGESPKEIVVRRNHQVVKKTTENRRQYSRYFKREIVNRFENHNESIDDLTRSAGVTKASIYSWRRQILGRAGTKLFTEKARELAHEFIEVAQVDDVVTQANGRDSEPYLQLHPDANANSHPQLQTLSSVQTLDTIEAVVSNQPHAILASVEQIDRQLLDLQKDRQILVQQLEIQNLRRALSQTDGSL